MSYLSTTDFASAPFEIIDGDRGPNYPKQTEFYDNGHCLFLNATNVTRRGFDFASCQFITEKKDELLRKGKLQREDIVLTTRGTIGNVGYFSAIIPFDQMRINSGMVILRCDPKRILPAYLYHFLRSPQFHGQVNALRSGVAQPQLPIRDMKRIKLPLPHFFRQKAIASILSAYDDLIENNRRRIQLLEKAARLLYKEWFVHLRFPGHEHVKIIDGMPEGWERKRLGDVALTNVNSYKRNELPEPLKYIDIGSVRAGRILEKSTLSAIEAPGRARRMARHGDVIWSNVRPNLRAYALIMHPIEVDVYSTGFTIIEPKSVPFSFLYQCVTTSQFVGHLVNHATGAGYPAVRPDDFECAELLVPTDTLLGLFHEAVEQMHEQQSVLESQITSLAKARDLLLPRLMNGEILV